VAEPQISVIVPTHDRPESLARCLAALDAQTARDSMEVLIVDDGSRFEAVERAVRRFAGCRHLRAPRRGAAASRNAGAAAARGSLLLFTDDDCVPRPDWAATLATPLGEDAVAVAGTTLIGSSQNQLGAASQHIADYLMTTSLNTSRRIRFAPSSNLGCRAEVVRALPFDESYPASGGEDRDWCARLIQTGHDLSFVPEAMVAHHPQLTIGGFWSKHAGYGRGARIFRHRHGAPDASPIPAFHLGLLRDGFRRGRRVGALVCLAQAATASGFARQAIADRS
jgi:GT2 family glycosyltransferase